MNTRVFDKKGRYNLDPEQVKGLQDLTRMAGWQILKALANAEIEIAKNKLATATSVDVIRQLQGGIVYFKGFLAKIEATSDASQEQEPVQVNERYL